MSDWDFDPTKTEGKPTEGAGVGSDTSGDTRLPPPLKPPPQPQPEVDMTGEFQPGATSTPGGAPPEETSNPFGTGATSTTGGEDIELSSFDIELSDLPDGETLLLQDFMDVDEQKTYLKKKLQLIKDKFKTVNFKKLGPSGFGKTAENKGEPVICGEKEYRTFRKDGSGLLKSFTDKFKQTLGPRTEDLISEENQEIREERQRLKESEKKTERSGKACVRTGKSSK